MTPHRSTLASVADRCFRALSPYDLRRHYVAAVGRGEGLEDDGAPTDLYHRLRPEQRRGIDAGLAAVALRVYRERPDDQPADLPPACMDMFMARSKGQAFVRETWAARRRRSRAANGGGPGRAAEPVRGAP